MQTKKRRLIAKRGEKTQTFSNLKAKKFQFPFYNLCLLVKKFYVLHLFAITDEFTGTGFLF